LGTSFTPGHVIIAEFEASLEVALIQRDGLSKFIKHFRKTLQALISLGQPPMRGGQVVIDLNSIAKFQRCLLKLRFLQVSFTALDVIGFSFFCIGTTTQQHEDGEQGPSQRSMSAK